MGTAPRAVICLDGRVGSCGGRTAGVLARTAGGVEASPLARAVPETVISAALMASSATATRLV